MTIFEHGHYDNKGMRISEAEYYRRMNVILESETKAAHELNFRLLRESKTGIDYAVLQSENRRLRKVLKWYAGGNHNALNDNDINGKGRKAREALAINWRKVRKDIREK